MSYIALHDLKVYQLSCDYGQKTWLVYEDMDWRLKMTMGDQWLRSTDSVGANIAEGFGRYHYLDKIKFYYNARASLFESKHWSDLIYKRKIINQEKYFELSELYKNISLGLNGLINSIYKKKDQNS